MKSAAIISPRQVLLRESICQTVHQCWGILPLKKLKVGQGGVRTPPPELLPIIASNCRAQNSDEQKQVARDLVAYYSDNVRPDYHSCIKNYESPDKCRKKEDAAVPTAIHTHIEFERHNPPKL